ncbi:MAG: response regulator [Nitrospinae bacterium]|nr:response regulator [Nitrospinota bacterium]
MKKMTALIIDDSKLSRNLLKHYIFSEYDDVEIIEESTGQSGLTAYFEQKPNLTFLDLTMPEMNGFEFLQAVKEKGKLGKVVVLSADVQEISRTMAKSLGADYFIAKPIKTQLLLINEIVDKVRAELGLSALELADWQKDAIAEIFNIGSGRAADSLSRLTGQPITMSVPSVEVVERAALGHYVKERLGLKEKVIALQQGFKGDFHGLAFLILPSPELKELVKLVVGSEGAGEDVEETYKDSILEIGNIVVSACIGAFGNTVETPLSLMPPSYSEDDQNPFAHASGDATFMRYALVARASLLIKDRNIEGFIVVIMSVNSMKLLLQHLERMMKGK